jgi:hypothetical protein
MALMLGARSRTRARSRLRTKQRSGRSGTLLRSWFAGCTAVFAVMVGLPLHSASVSVPPAGANVVTGTHTFFFTGTTQTFVVPQGVTRLTVDAHGAQGSKVHPQEPDEYGGLGGRVQGDLSVSPGQLLFIEVGGAGKDYRSLPGNGGYNGGGNGTRHQPVATWGGGGGGGATDIRLGGLDADSRLLSAGGGGGGSVSTPGGASGSAGSNGTYGALPGGGGAPGTTSVGAGGMAGSAAAESGQPGTWEGVGGQGGNGASGSNQDGGGGGGGWRGGGGGGGAGGDGAGDGATGGGGGGGSSRAPRMYNVTITNGVHSGDGSLKLSWVAPVSRPVAPTPVTVRVDPATQQRGGLSQTARLTAIVVDQYGDPIGGVPVTFTRSGVNTDRTGTTVVSQSDGTATYTYGSLVSGTDIVYASVTGPTPLRGAGAVLWGTGVPGHEDSYTTVAFTTPIVSATPGDSVNLNFAARDGMGEFTGTVRYGSGSSCEAPTSWSSTTTDASGTGTITVTAGDAPTCVQAYADRVAVGTAGSRDDTEVLALGAVVAVGPPPSPGTALVFTTPVASAPVGVTTFAALKALRHDGGPFVGTVRWGYGPAGSSPQTPYTLELRAEDNGSGSVPVPAATSPTEVVGFADRGAAGRVGTRDEAEVLGVGIVLGAG